MQYLAKHNTSTAEQRQAALRQVMRSFQRFEGDTGSSEVQGAPVFDLCPALELLLHHLDLGDAQLPAL